MTTTYVIREDGRWLLAPGSGPVPEVVAFADVQRLVAGPPHPDPPSTAPLADDTLLAPVWCWVGMVTPSGVLVAGNDGDPLVLDALDLRLLDALDATVAVGALAASSGIGDTSVRMARLVRAGRVRSAPAGGPPPVTVSPPPPRLPSLPPRVPPTTDAPATAADAVAADDDRIGVHAVWQERAGPALSLGMLTAAARAWEDGALGGRYRINRPETADEVLAALRRRPGPAVLLCSNYVWSVDFNLELARQAKELCPELVVIHGGPSTPKYPGDAERFLDEHGHVADVLVRGEGEVTLCRLLEALAPALPELDPARLAGVAGLTFRDPTSGAIVRTAEPERVADLDTLPSPYLTGEFDHIDPAAWRFAVSIETNRGCPYGCTFCDWGSAILSRIRKFDRERVLAEFRWAAERGVGGVQICDANFGIMARDVDLARGFADIRRRIGAPMGMGFTPPKNTTRHVTQIFDEIMGAGFLISTAISLQSTDETTLAAVDRSNISTGTYLALAADLRRRGHPLMGDLLLGLPAQTYRSYKADLQFFVDHQIMARTWIVKVLPNSPMNAPEYRARYGIQTDVERSLVTSTASLSEADLARGGALRRAEIIGQRLAVLRHLGLFLQWEHDLAVMDVLEHLLEVTQTTPDRFPLITWLFDHFDLHATVAVGWHAFYEEVRRLLAEDYGLDPQRSDLDAVLRLQIALMPAPEREFPSTVDLAHDYVAYFREATASLFTAGEAATPSRPLSSYPPAAFTVTGDPLGLCTAGLRFDGDSRDAVFEGDFAIGQRAANELESPLLAMLPVFSGRDAPLDDATLAAVVRADLAPWPAPSRAPEAPDEGAVRVAPEPVAVRIEAP